MKRFTLTAAAIAVAALTISLLRTDPVAEAQAPASGLGNVYAEQCIVKLRKQDQAQVASERPGIIEFIEFEEGDPIQKGQLVARLKDGVARATLDKEMFRATNDVHIRYADAAFKVSQQELQIALDTNARVPGTVPTVEIEKLRLAVDKARLQREQAVFEQDLAKKTVIESEESLKTHEIRAPFSGVVSAVFRTQGEAVRQGDPILEIISTEVVRVEGLVTIADGYRIKAGDKVDVELDAEYYRLPPGLEGKKLPGEITFVDPRNLPVIGKAKVVAKVENPLGHLRAELRAKMMITPARTPATAARR